MFSGSATPDGTSRFAARFPGYGSAGFYRTAQGLSVSTLGIGSYLGPMDDATDANYTQAIRRALAEGINFIDTSLNYRHQRSEKAIGAALSAWVHEDRGARDEVVICTKAGFLVPRAIPLDSIRAEDITGGMHCMSPAFLADQIGRSRANLGVDTIDVFYLHNPETQLGHIPDSTFHQRIRAAFERLEQLVETGEIRHYGAATWDGFRKGDPAPPLSLERLASIAREIAGDSHHFRYAQLPVNLAMTEALSRPLAEGRTVLEAARELGITVVSSASILQARLARGLPDELAAALPRTRTDAQRAIQFTRSVPGVTVALVGMSKAEHVDENLGIASIAPVPPDDFVRTFA